MTRQEEEWEGMEEEEEEEEKEEEEEEECIPAGLPAHLVACHRVPGQRHEVGEAAAGGSAD